MIRYLVDTDVLSYVLKQDTRAQWYAEKMSTSRNIISFMTFAELEHWALQGNWGSRRYAEFQLWLDQFVLVNSNQDLARIWAQVKYSTRSVAISISTADAWIAATAIYLDVPVLTNNRRHFESVPGLTVLSNSSE